MSTARVIAVPFMVALAAMLLAGCQNTREAVIPVNAQIATSGNDRLTYTAPQDGMIWVYNVPGDSVLYSGPLHMGQTIVVDPHNNDILIGDHAVVTTGLNVGTQYRVYFEPQSINNP